MTGRRSTPIFHTLTEQMHRLAAQMEQFERSCLNQVRQAERRSEECVADLRRQLESLRRAKARLEEEKAQLLADKSRTEGELRLLHQAVLVRLYSSI
jgi:chromosome segregation ATPase